MLTANFFRAHLAASARLYRQFSGKELSEFMDLPMDPHLISQVLDWAAQEVLPPIIFSLRCFQEILIGSLVAQQIIVFFRMTLKILI